VELAPDERTWARGQVVLSGSEDNLDGPLADLQRAIEIARMHGDQRLEAEAWMCLSSRAVRKGDYSAAEEAAEQAQALFHQAEHRGRQAAAMSLMGLSRIRAQRSTQAEQPLREAARAAGDLGDRRSQADALGRLSMVLAQSDRVDEARTTLQRSLALSTQIGDRVGEGFCLVNLGALTHEPAEATDLFRRAAAMGRLAGHVQLENVAMRNVGTSELLRGMPERAIPVLLETYERHVELADGHRTFVGILLALAYTAAGQRDKATLLLDVPDADGENVHLLTLAAMLAPAMDDPAFNWARKRDAYLGSVPQKTWDIGLVVNVIESILDPTKQTPVTPDLP
jgi:tetratricopeptide (TPR) repeat protein